MKENIKYLLMILLSPLLLYLGFLTKEFYWVSHILTFLCGFCFGYGATQLVFYYRKQIIHFINDIIYIKYYDKTLYANKLLVIGFLRGVFGFKLFIYIDL